MKFQSNCSCNRLHLHVIDPNSAELMCLMMLVCNSKIHFHQLGRLKLIQTILKSLNLSPLWNHYPKRITIHGLSRVQLSCMMNLKIEFAKNKCLGTIWSTEMIPIA